MDMKQAAIIADLIGIRSSQNGVIDAANDLTQGYKRMQEKYEAYENAEDDRNKLVSAVAMQNETILEILASIVVNNKNLATGIKDVLALKYAKCEQAINSDEKLRACIDAIKEALHTQSDEVEEKEA
jgi:aminopeptidase N